MKARDYKDPTDLIAHSLRADGFDASEDGTGRGTPLIPIAFDCKASGRSGFGVGEIASTMRSMNNQDSHANDGSHLAVAHAIQAGALRENPLSGPDGVGVQREVAYTLEARAEVQAVQQRWAVRRLTPRECERLMGFPDDYTLVPWRGKLATDGPRYKALGNAMAVNTMRWIGTRIAAVEALKEAA